VAWPVFTEQPTLVGHRGMGAGVVDGYRENTVESFLAALACGIDWVEADVRRTSDDGLFVCHDAALPDGLFLSDIPSAAARELGIVGLEDLLEALPPSAGVVFDVKSSLADAGRSSAATTATLLARTCARVLGDRPALAQSFDPAALLHMRQALPGLALGLLTWDRFPVGFAVAAAAHLDVQVLAVHVGSLVPGALTGFTVPPMETILTAVHEAQRQLMVWCPSPRRARALQAAGVDAMVVDDLPRHVRTTAKAER
jgi:glycerophosphoryl diester phosphodiesterase